MSLKKEVLNAFKILHKTRKSVFEGDLRALNLAREKINEEFKKNKHLDDTNKIKELVGYTKNVEEELRTSVIQAREVQPGKYEAVIKPGITKLDNIPFRDFEEEKECKK